MLGSRGSSVLRACLHPGQLSAASRSDVLTFRACWPEERRGNRHQRCQSSQARGQEAFALPVHNQSFRQTEYPTLTTLHDTMLLLVYTVRCIFFHCNHVAMIFFFSHISQRTFIFLDKLTGNFCLSSDGKIRSHVNCCRIGCCLTNRFSL